MPNEVDIRAPAASDQPSAEHVGHGPALTSFIGRSTQLAGIAALLKDASVRLLTLTGPGGVGKTRLAEMAAIQAQPLFANDVHFVSFASAVDRARLPLILAEAFRIQSAGNESIESRLLDHLRDRKALLVLDNLEHLLPLPFLARLLGSCPGLTILATSRERLRLSGEFEYVVPPMELPENNDFASPHGIEQVESVALLVDRTRQGAPDFQVTHENLESLVEICTQLDGLPLALELAAARLKVFSPPDLLEHLQHRLALLTGGPMDRPMHQRTIRDTIAWSFDLLGEREQAVFRRLGIFVSGFTMEAMAAVCMAPAAGVPASIEAVDILTSLVDKSLVQRTRREEGKPRFHLIETVRHFALEHLEAAREHDEVANRHAAWYVSKAEAIAPLLIGPDQAELSNILDLELDNVRLALRTLRDAGDIESMTRLAGAMWRFWRLRGMLAEGRAWFEIVLDPPCQESLSADLQASSLFMAGWLALEHGDTDTATRYGDASLAIAQAANDDNNAGLALRLLSIIDSRHNRREQAWERMKESAARHRRANDANNLAGALNNLAILALDVGDYGQVIEYCTESRDRFRELGNLYGASHSIDTMGIALYCTGRFEEAMVCCHESLAIDRTLVDVRGLAVSLDHAGKCARALGDLEFAWNAHAESLPYRQEVGDPAGLLVWLEAMALWMAAVGNAELTAQAIGVAEVTRVATSSPLQVHEEADHRQAESEARAALGDQVYERLVARGRWISLDDMIAQLSAAAPSLLETSTADTSLVIDHLAALHALTPREIDVLTLLGRRYTDKEIAGTLSISPRTVARHVSGVLGKLDVRTRREAAALVEASESGGA